MGIVIAARAKPSNISLPSPPSINEYEHLLRFAPTLKKNLQFRIIN